MSRRVIWWIVLGAIALHAAAFFWLSRQSLPQARETPRGPYHFEHIAVRVPNEEGDNMIVRQYTVSTDLVDPTPQFVPTPQPEVTP